MATKEARTAAIQGFVTVESELRSAQREHENAAAAFITSVSASNRMKVGASRAHFSETLNRLHVIQQKFQKAKVEINRTHAITMMQ